MSDDPAMTDIATQLDSDNSAVHQLERLHQTAHDAGAIDALIVISRWLRARHDDDTAMALLADMNRVLDLIRGERK